MVGCHAVSHDGFAEFIRIEVLLCHTYLLRDVTDLYEAGGIGFEFLGFGSIPPLLSLLPRWEIFADRSIVLPFLILIRFGASIPRLLT